MDKLVVASYFPWYGVPHGPTQGSAHWFGEDGSRLYLNTPPFPLYDSRDPVTIRRQCNQAVDAGIDAFAVSWWGSDEPEDVTIPIVLDHCLIPCALQFETPGIVEKGKNIGAELLYALTRYATHPNLLKIDGRPVVFLYNPDDIPLWQTILAHPAIRTFNPLVIADCVNDESAMIFDGVYYWGPAIDYINGTLEDNYNWGRNVAKAHGKLWCATVFPGYNDVIIREQTANVDRTNGFVLLDTWLKAINSQPDIIHVMSWNEWHEGSELEGSEQHQSLNRALCAYWKGQILPL